MKINSSCSAMRMCVLMLLLAGMVWQGYAQEQTIKLQDEQHHKALSDVYFSYGNKTGVSAKDGTISIVYQPHELLYLSHIVFGKLEIPAELVKKATTEGVLNIAETEHHLAPVTLVQVRSTGGDPQRIDLSAQNKLAHDAGSLLEAVPSISSIRKSGAYGFDPVLRGFKYDQINLVLDGVQTASAACPNRMDPSASQVPINMISQAEVLKGPHTLRFGNNFGGTINFKSPEPEFPAQTKPVGRIGSSYESNGNIFRTEAVAGLVGKSVDFRMFGAYSTGDDYTDGDGVDIPARFNRLNWGGKLALKISDTQTLGFMASNNVAKDVDFPALSMDLREDNTWLLNASHSASFYRSALSSWKTSVYATMVDHVMDNYDKLVEPRTVDAETNAETRNFGGRSELRFDFEGSFLYSGIDVRSESADGFRTREMLMGNMAGTVLTDNVWQDAHVTRTGVFGEWHLQPTGYQLVVSARIDVNHAKANDPDPGFSAKTSDLESTIVHPSLSVGGTRLFSKNLSLGLWLGRASRSPGITERYINQFPIGLDPYEMLGNPDLDPEVNNQLDVVFQYQSAHSHISVNLFGALLRDYISSEIRDDIEPVMASAPGVRQFVNIDKALMSGFEITWNQELFPVLSHEMSVNYTYGENRMLDEPLPEIPPLELRYRLTGSFAGHALQPEIALRHAARQDRIAISYGETETPAFTVVDAKLSWQALASLVATAGVQNVFDTAYYEHLARSVKGTSSRAIYSPGRSFYFTVSYQF